MLQIDNKFDLLVALDEKVGPILFNTYPSAFLPGFPFSSHMAKICSGQLEELNDPKVCLPVYVCPVVVPLGTIHKTPP